MRGARLIGWTNKRSKKTYAEAVETRETRVWSS